MIYGTIKLIINRRYFEMKANRMWLFSDVLEKNKRVFKVPVYQRNYDWTNIQCEKLFQDIMKAGENINTLPVRLSILMMLMVAVG